ncbi:hypothetical protein BpHYR1_047940 [Brachionus plicatilis]|uniref:Uncharacterized protein n=1 Tax=Brachionus plicatilis TaxID=10195 RepID=A0A3M7S117_BRAPC|nr:hypothetical protein BpHYR1_047940 [Brachionus plicatilis]
MPIQTPKRCPNSTEDRIKAGILQQNGQSYTEITIIDRYNQTNQYEDRPRSGRPKISTDQKLSLITVNCQVAEKHQILWLDEDYMWFENQD